MTSFVTAIKLMPGYEDYHKRLRLYIECIATYCKGDYEIIVVEDRNEKNTAFLSDYFDLHWLATRHARVVEYDVNYPNPYGYNMIEAYAKNIGLCLARFPFVCITNSDILFHPSFFDVVFEPRTFYRFVEYEITNVNRWDLQSVEEQYKDAVCINPDLLDENKWNLKTIAYKSGDAMLLDKTTWLEIGGFPENEVWVHSDLIVCTVVNNNCIPLKVVDGVKIYTFVQERTLVERDHELAKTYEYLTKKRCN